MYRRLLLVLLFACRALGATTVQGPLSGNTTWTVSGSPYQLVGDVTVPVGATLTIQPGVTVNASVSDGLSSGGDSGRTELVVLGALKVLGTAQQPVVMTTSGARGAWYGINLYASNQVTTLSHVLIDKAYRGVDSDGLVNLDNVVIQNTYDSCVILFGGTANITKSTLSNCGLDAVFALGTSTLNMSYTLVTGTGQSAAALNLSGTATLDHNTIADNGWGGIDLDGTRAIVLTNNILAKNGSHGIRRLGSNPLTFQANNIWSHTTNLSGMPVGTGNLSVDPRFVAPGNYRLQAASPCRGTGLDGSDMGAFAFTPTLRRIELSPSTPSVSAKGSVAFTARAFDESNFEVATPFTWVANEAAGSISPTGVFTAGCTLGTTPSAVTVSAGGLSASAQVTVTSGPLSALNVQPASLTLPVRATQAFTAQGLDACGNPLSPAVSWQAVSAAGSITPSGVFTATSTPGTWANAVTASAGGMSKSVSVTVTTGAVAQVTVTPSTVTLSPEGTQAFTAVAKDAAGNTVNLPATWSLVNGGGSLQSSGLFTASTKAGTYAQTVEASVGGIVGRATVIVQPGNPARLVVSPLTATLAPLGQTTFSALVFDAHNNLCPNPVTWSVLTSSAGGITSGGVFTAGRSPGQFPASVRAQSGNASSTANVVIEEGALSKLLLTPSRATVRAGGTLAFAVIGQDAAGNVVPVTPRWKVLRGGGTIDAQGVFSAGTLPGEFLNTVQVEMNGVAAQASVTVLHGPLAEVRVSPSYPELVEGQTQQFTAKALDAFGNELPSVTVEWAVDERAGTLDAEGRFSAGNNSGDFENAIVARVGAVVGTASVRILPPPTPVQTGPADPLSRPSEVELASGCGCQGASGLLGTWALLTFFGFGFRRPRRQN